MNKIHFFSQNMEYYFYLEIQKDVFNKTSLNTQ